MSKRQSEKAKPVPTAAEALAAVRYQLIGQEFVIHTLARLIAQKTSCEFHHAEAIAQGMISAGTVVPASKVGLTALQTFKLRTDE